MEAMTEREEGRQLRGFVQIDDAYLGGERNGGKRGRGSENKQPFVIAVSTDHELEHPTFAIIEPVRDFSNRTLLEWGQRRLAADAEAFSDGLVCFGRLADLGHAHTVLVTGGGLADAPAGGQLFLVEVNDVHLGLLANELAGVHEGAVQGASQGAAWLGGGFGCTRVSSWARAARPHPESKPVSDVSTIRLFRLYSLP